VLADQLRAESSDIRFADLFEVKVWRRLNIGIRGRQGRKNRKSRKESAS
jgi:hypothetical protein